MAAVTESHSGPAVICRVRVFSGCFQEAASLQGNKQPASLMAIDPLVERPSLGFL